MHLGLLWVQQFKGHLLELLLKLFPLRGKLALLRAKKPGEGELVMLGMLQLGILFLKLLIVMMPVHQLQLGVLGTPLLGTLLGLGPLMLVLMLLVKFSLFYNSF